MSGIGEWIRDADWVAIGTVAFTGVTAAATVYALVQRRWERPRPQWNLASDWNAFEGVGARDAYGNDRDVVSFTLSNVGDGAAYAVRIRARGGCELAGEGRWPMIAPGGSERFAVRVVGQVEGSSVLISWRQPPWRGKNRWSSHPLIVKRAFPGG